MKTLLTSFEAARLVGCAPDTIRQGARLGFLKAAAVTSNGVRLFRPEDVEAWNRRRPKRQRAPLPTPNVA